MAANCADYPDQLAVMRNADQASRSDPYERIESISMRLRIAYGTVGVANVVRMKELLQRCGWPITSKFGKQASLDAWLLVQHADHDRQFQREAIVLLEQAVKQGEASGKDLAYLSDRIAVAEGKPQLYGTQFKGVENCEFVFQPMDSREAVAARRQAVPGMITLEEYKKMMEQRALPPHCKADPAK